MNIKKNGINKRKKALLLCSSHNDLGLIHSLRKLNYYIISIGNTPGLVGEKYVDKYVQMDYSDKKSVLEFAKQEKIDAIVQCCNDYGVYTASYVAEKLGLPGYDSYEVTLKIHNKDRFKDLADKFHLSTPDAKRFSDFETAINYINNASYPLIVKPVDASAGNGIKRINNIEEAKMAISYAFSKTRSGRILVEDYVTGSQHGFCTFLIDQKVVAVSSNNEYSILNSYRVEIDTFPADNYERVKDTLITQIEKIARELELKDGIFHIQYIMNHGEPQIIEAMRRILGNMYSVPANRLCGFDWDYWETRAKCGLSLKNFPKNNYQEGFYAYKTILADKNGEIVKIAIPKRYEKYVYDNCILKNPGDNITNYLSEPIGFLFMEFGTEQEMMHFLIDDYVNGMVTIKTS